MALPNRIELNGGADLALQRIAWFTWLAALASVMLHAQRMPPGLLLLVAAVLLWSVPSRTGRHQPGCRLVLHNNGQAQWGEVRGVWLDSTWRSRWFTVIRFHSDTSRLCIWVSARNNSKDDYRHLGTWCNFSPRTAAASANDSH